MSAVYYEAGMSKLSSEKRRGEKHMQGWRREQPNHANFAGSENVGAFLKMLGMHRLRTF